MLIVYHDYHKIVEVTNETESIVIPSHKSIIEGILAIASIYNNTLLIWCALEAKSFLNIHNLKKVFHHNGIMASYSPDKEVGIHKAIGYVDATPFVNVNKKVPYPTWSMSALVGGVNTDVIVNFSKQNILTLDFEMYLNLLSRQGMWNGLCCFSEPSLLVQNTIDFKSPKINSYTNLFKFIRFHYKTQWLFYVLFCIVYFERKIPLISFFNGFFAAKSDSEFNCLEGINIHSVKKFKIGTIDVLIPTIGRKSYLYDFLLDLKKQTFLPVKIIIVEQNPLFDSVSELDYLQKEQWPFEIEHIFTHTTGACNARNKALEKVTGDWIFFADDDIRITPDFLEKSLQQMKKYGQMAASFSCHKKDEKQTFKVPIQWGTFGSGCSIVNTENVKNMTFDLSYEFGFGEDGDFGMQLRNSGTDVFYFPEPSILHLKAPVGGFRTKPVLAWHKEEIQPKPSPTVMLYQMKYLTKEQRRSEKVKLFLNYYRVQSIKNPIRYFQLFKKQWKQSEKWATRLLKND